MRKLKIDQPCAVSRDTMAVVGERDRYCQQCNKVVHNLVGKSDAELRSLFAANGGRLCGSILVRKPLPLPEIRLAKSLVKTSFFKHWAATASLLLLTQTAAHVSAQTQARVEWHDQGHADTNGADGQVEAGRSYTLITGVVVNQHSEPVPLDFEIEIYANRVRVASVIAYHGLFKCELEGKVSPDAIVGLIIRKNTATDPENGDLSEHGTGQMTVRLREAQNLNLRVHYDFRQQSIIEMGDIMGPEFDAGEIDALEKPPLTPDDGL